MHAFAYTIQLSIPQAHLGVELHIEKLEVRPWMQTGMRHACMMFGLWGKAGDAAWMRTGTHAACVMFKYWEKLEVRRSVWTRACM